MKSFKELIILLLIVICASGCATKKKKSDQNYGKIKEVYHNMSSKYNGFWNAEQLMMKAELTLNDQHQADYSNILEVYPYLDVENPSAVASDMDVVAKKMARIVKIHDKSDWIDDTYVMLGKSQFLKQDFETAEETFQYFEEEFNPNNPNSRLYNKSKNKRLSKDEKQDKKKKERKLKEENMKEAKKEKADSREDAREAKDEKRKETQKFKDEIKELKTDLRKAKDKRKKEEKKAREKARKKKKRIKKDPNKDPRSAKEIELEAKIKAKEDAYKKFQEGDKINEAVEEATKEEKEKLLAEEKQKEEDEAKRKEREKRKKISHDDPKGLFKGKLAFHEGVYWLARTYIERENYFSAEYLFRQLENEYPTKPEIKELIPAARAHMLLRQKEYDNAIPHLESAIRNEKEKSLKARYTYILGQIHQKNGRAEKARMAFNNVDKFKPDYDLKFNSKLNLAKAAYKSGNTSKEATIRSLEKMLKDRKNEDFQDQIHYTIGDIHESDNDINSAIASYQKSIQSSISNKKQQVESYYRIANLLYERDRFSEASAYFDSTLTLIDKKDDRYFSVKDNSVALKDIALNIESVNLQDSLLRLSRMSPDDLRKILEKIVEERKLAEAANEPSKTGKRPSSLKRRNGFGNNKSGLWVYDETLVLAGKKVFEKKWGQRSLSDNWRRSNRLGAEDLDIEEEEEEANDDELDQAIALLLAEIPNTPAKKAKVNKAREDALFQLGKLFRDNIANNEKCVETLELLLNDYPKTNHETDALFYLYLAHDALGNTSKSRTYKNKLIEKYPNAKFAKSITDPNFAKADDEEKNGNDQMYSSTYEIFEQGNHAEVLKRVDEAFKKLDKSHPLAPKFSLLQAMSIGNINGKEEYINSLNNVISKYPNTTEERRAKEILRFIRGDQKAFDSRLYDEALEAFTVDDTKMHYVLVIIYDWSEKVLQEAKIKISDYNKRYHSLDKLKISDLSLNKDEETQLILIRKFRNKEKAMKYFNGVEKNNADFINPNKIGFDIFVATQKNYREIAKKKGVAEYRSFFEKHYLNDKN